MKWVTLTDKDGDSIFVRVEKIDVVEALHDFRCKGLIRTSQGAYWVRETNEDIMEKIKEAEA